MTVLSYDRYCDEIVTQTGLLTSAITGADLTAQVPSCPDWNVGQLLRHLGGAQRWVAEIVRSRAAGPVRREFTDLSAYTREDPAVARTLHFHATDTPPEAAAEWVIDLTGEAITWRRAHEKAAVAVRGPLTDLLLVLYRRRPADGLEVLGDAGLLDLWLDRAKFG
jgi:hypothetical protein